MLLLNNLFNVFVAKPAAVATAPVTLDSKSLVHVGGGVAVYEPGMPVIRK